MRVLVTGSYGQLGSELKEISREFPQWDYLFTDIDSLDITDEGKVQQFFRSEKPDFVINCAAYTAVDDAEKDYETARKINAFAPGFIAKSVREVNAGFINISTDYVFSGETWLPYSEGDKENPLTVYGKTKLEGEQRCLSVNPQSIIIRTSWLYSSYGNNFVKKMLQLGENNESLKVVIDQIGTPTYAADLARAVFSIIRFCEKNSERHIYGIYHFSNEGVASWYDFARTIFDISGINCKVYPVLSEEFIMPAKRPHYSVLNKSKIKSTFDLKIPYWRDSLKICVEKISKK
jgi:dTDP-4-dehydrorhamnose reductase